MEKENQQKHDVHSSVEEIRTCHDVLMVLPDYRNQSLDLDTMRAVKDHLENCFSCRQSLSDFNRIADEH